MPGIMELLTAANRVYDAMKGGEYVEAWAATIDIQQFAIEALKGAGFRSLPPGAGGETAEGDPAADEETKEQVLAKLKEAKKLADATAKKKTPKKGAVGAGPVGKLGDGKLLRKLLEALLVILPVIFSDDE